MKNKRLAVIALCAALVQSGCSQFAAQQPEQMRAPANERVVTTAPLPVAEAPPAQPKPAAPAPAPQRPQYETKKVDGTNNVYIYRYGNNQSMFVVTRAGVIATDPIGYGHPEATKTYVAEIRKITKQPIRYVIYSHHHFDHIAGGAPFKAAGARFVAHERVKERLALVKDPATVMPDETFKKVKTITLGGTTLKLQYLGLNHSDSTIVMLLPKEKLVFAVDFAPVGSVPGLAMIDSYPLEWETSLKHLLAMDWQRLIPGHPGAPDGRLGTKQDVKDTLTFLHEASEQMKPIARAGKCWQPAVKEFSMPKYEKWLGYAAARPLVAHRYCSLWGRGT